MGVDASVVVVLPSFNHTFLHLYLCLVVFAALLWLALAGRADVHDRRCRRAFFVAAALVSLDQLHN